VNTTADHPIQTAGLTKFYGPRRGLAGLDLAVEQGEIFGFLGPNGAGKTTTIRLLLDLIRPTSGTAMVLGHSPREGGPALRRRIGYLAGDFVVDVGQSVRDLLNFLGDLRGGVTETRISALADRFELELDTRIASLSKGNRQKVGIVQAFMHEPELLILDEPTAGLDPLMQQRVLALLRETRAAGQTVFMSSHVLSEVQQIADRVGIVREGKLIALEGVKSLRGRAVRRVEISFEELVAADEFASLPGVQDAVLDETRTVLHCRLVGRGDPLVKAAARHPVATLAVEEPDLEELFMAYYGEAEAQADGSTPAAGSADPTSVTTDA
jgi:ABC-2 type transport system ATP-binding protein